MEVTAKKTDSANVSVEAKIAKTDIDKKVEKIAKQAAKQMKIDGFRPGKAPVSVVKKRLGDRLVQDAEAEALREVLNTASKELELDAEKIIGEPAVTKFDRGEEFIEVELKLSLRPEIEIGDISDIIPEVKTPRVTKKEVEERIKELAEAQAPFESVEEDRGLQEGDLAVFDFEGFLNGEPFEGGKAEDFELRIGSGQFIPGFEEQMMGMKKGEEKTIKVTFPEDYRNKELAGKEVEFKIKLKEIKAKKPVEIDDELAKKLLGDENGTLEKLEKEVKEQIRSEKLSKLYNEELKPQLVEALVEQFEFDLPESVVEQEIEMALRNKVQQMSEEELGELRENEEKVKALRDELRGDAAKSVKATFIVDALAKKEGIEVNDQEMMQTIYYEAMSMGQDPQQTFEYYQKQNLLPAIKMAMIEDRLLTKLLNDKNDKSENKEETTEKEEA
ncbi:trigger factor [Hydrogenimonas cancrithermarum]|uniref:Trigger factor n=1 Tax=Hydrogenimonas cancrithermarum TaxID=2993563 RepID=A0ABM8FKQ6_9BACT|nr:trigger factor [Hydrogenimonas cancrithermarum]BDY12890.1 trigger factor [Hydrogenimonas cancrithermarum]BDY13007.1 trigger factor [Hydrogenimonas cancrithermarum]